MSGKENADEVDKKSKHLRGMSILVSFIYIAFGLLLVIFPTQMANLVCILLGVISLVFGIVRLTKYFTKSKEEAAMAYDLVVGILFIALGVVVLVFQKGVLSILPIV